ncbi:hypothetical protein WJX74_002477 [Apatococcus lobatus]|uniref:Uncharacterized protein n=2 Tax=Apatococcus TaxID=904362 RepID=A0AAW1SCQ5_9CHLO
MRHSACCLSRNLFQLVNNLPQKGTGYRVKRANWPEGQFWELTTVRPSVDGAHGDAWGVAYAEGSQAAEAPRKVRSTLKGGWQITGDPPSSTPGRVNWKRVVNLKAACRSLTPAAASETKS